MRQRRYSGMVSYEWKINYYESKEGKSPIFDFIQSLDIKAQSRVFHVLELLKEFGIKLGLPHAKKLVGTDLWELRILGNSSIRIFYIITTGRTFLLLHGFQKKKNKTDHKAIKIAQIRLKDYE